MHSGPGEYERELPSIRPHPLVGEIPEERRICGLPVRIVSHRLPGTPGFRGFEDPEVALDRLGVLGAEDVAFEAGVVADAYAPADAVGILENRLLVAEVRRPRGCGARAAEPFVVRLGVEDPVLVHADEEDLAGLVHGEAPARPLHVDEVVVDVVVARVGIVLSKVENRGHDHAVSLVILPTGLRPRGALVRGAVKCGLVIAREAGARADPRIEDATDGDDPVRLSPELGGVFSAEAAPDVVARVARGVAFDPCVSEAHAAVAVRASEAPAVAPRRVLVVVIGPRDCPVVAPGAETLVGREVERHIKDRRTVRIGRAPAFQMGHHQ